MALDYSALEVRVSALLDKYGTQDCRVVRAGAGTADPTMPWKPTGPQPDVIVADGLTSVSDNVGYRRGKRDADQALTESSSGKAYVRGALPTLLPGDWLEVPVGVGQYERFFISRAEPIKPGTVTVLWELSLRS